MKLETKKNKHGVEIGDVYHINYYGTNIFVRVCATMPDKVRVYELETYKYKKEHRILNKYRKEHPEDNISSTGWIEMLGKSAKRAKKVGNCNLIPIFKTNSRTSPSLVLRTAYVKNAPTVIIPISNKTPIFWEKRQTMPNCKIGYLYGKPIIRNCDHIHEKKIARYTFYPCAAPVRTRTPVIKID